MLFFFSAILNLYRLVILFIAFIHIICCLNIFLHETMQMGFCFLFEDFQDKFNHNYNYYFQCNRN